jgi:energy-coupling factor transporter ATP-binding protein EcfA2
MASVLDQILEWSTSRPTWQQDALRRLVQGDRIDDEVIALYAGCCLGEKTELLEPLQQHHVRRAAPEANPVGLVAIRDAQNVNSLTQGEKLTFAASGLTVVYGNNGAGKSGYARILKAVTRTRAHERVRNDVFREPSLIPSATIEYRVDDRTAVYRWTSEASGPEELARISFFDRACGDIYLSRDTDVAFRPFGLSLFDQLVATSDRVRARLDRQADELARRTAGLPILDESSRAGLFLKRLSARTSNDQFEEATAISSKDEERLRLLTDLVDRHQRGTAAGDSDSLRRLAARAERLTIILDGLANQLSIAGRDELVRLRDDARTKAETARIARAENLSGALLGGVGESTWRALWEAARAYSQTGAYPNREFPVVDDACVLCQQPLDEAAAARLKGFEEFVQGYAERAALVADTSYQQAMQRLDALVVREQSVADVIEDLLTVDRTLAHALEEYFAYAATRLVELGKQIRDGLPDVPTGFPTPPTGQLAAGVTLIRDKATELQLAAAGEGAVALAAELAELKARKALVDARPAVIAERDRLRLQARINAGKTAASTNSITQKSVELTSAVLTEVLMDRFSRETDRLGLENVVLRTVGGRRGVLMYRTGFAAAVQDVPLPEVLSEGEQNALGMAGFLSEVWTDASNSAVIFDDPVSSLDHERRDKVAERLVAIAMQRQTIVFTHDVAFVLALKKHAVLQSIAVTERSIEKWNTSPGHTQDHHKFSAKLVKERLAELDSMLSTVRAQRGTISDSEFRDETTKWYRLLRQTWERVIEESLVGGILTRDDLQVHPAMVRTLVLFDADDNRKLQHGYGRATELSEVHDESAVVNAPAPSLDDMQADLATLREWHKTITARRSYTDEKIYQLASKDGPGTS